MTSNQTTPCGVNASESYDWPRGIAFLISTALDWPRVHVLRHCVLNLYMLIPVISFCVHTEQNSGNLLMLQLPLLVNCWNEFTGKVCMCERG